MCSCYFRQRLLYLFSLFCFASLPLFSTSSRFGICEALICFFAFIGNVDSDGGRRLQALGKQRIHERRLSGSVCYPIPIRYGLGFIPGCLRLVVPCRCSSSLRIMQRTLINPRDVIKFSRLCYFQNPYLYMFYSFFFFL